MRVGGHVNVCARLNGCMLVTKADLLGRLFRLLAFFPRWLCLLLLQAQQPSIKHVVIFGSLILLGAVPGRAVEDLVPC